MQTGSPHPSDWEQLRAHGPLASISTAAVQHLVAAAEQRTYDAGELLMRQGDVADGLFMVLEGSGRVLLHDDEGEHWLGRVTAGDLVGEMALVTREPRSADVIADSPLRALVVPTAVFDRLASRYLELAMLLTQLVADRLGASARDGFGGKQVEGFRILRGVGRGGMSVVYRARDLETGELVALKMMSYRLIYDVQALVRFQHEADLLQELEHPNIARLKRLFPAYHTYFLVMELCEGADLQRLLIARGALPESEVRAILGQLARALDYVHQRGVIHRDLKPANVMIARSGDVKLTDFGVAAPASPLAGKTRTADHALVGTPSFMSPEQLDGDNLDSRTDIYSLGCLTYELLTARRLFTSTSLFGLVQEKATLKLPPASEIGGGISTEMHEFLERSLQVNRQDRLATVTPLIEWAARCQPPPADVVDAQSNAGATPVLTDTQAITRAD